MLIRGGGWQLYSDNQPRFSAVQPHVCCAGYVHPYLSGTRGHRNAGNHRRSIKFRRQWAARALCSRTARPTLHHPVPLQLPNSSTNGRLWSANSTKMIGLGYETGSLCCTRLCYLTFLPSAFDQRSKEAAQKHMTRWAEFSLLSLTFYARA